MQLSKSRRGFGVIDLVMATVVVGAVAAGAGLFVSSVAQSRRATQVQSQLNAYSSVANEVTLKGLNPLSVQPLAGVANTNVGSGSTSVSTGQLMSYDQTSTSTNYRSSGAATMATVSGSGATAGDTQSRAVSVGHQVQLTAAAVAGSGSLPLPPMVVQYNRSSGSGSTTFTYAQVTGDAAETGVNFVSGYDPIVLSVAGTVPSAQYSIYYTLDGSTPTSASNLYSGSFVPALGSAGWAGGITLKFIALPTGSSYQASSVATVTLTRAPTQLASPGLNPLPSGGTLAIGASIALGYATTVFDNVATVTGGSSGPVVFTNSSVIVPPVLP